jgi:hypothetical protein
MVGLSDVSKASFTMLDMVSSSLSSWGWEDDPAVPGPVLFSPLFQLRCKRNKEDLGEGDDRW